MHELAEILAFDFDAVNAEGIPELNCSLRWEDEEEAIMSTCSNLVIKVKDGKNRWIFQFSHFSVKEFLTSNRLAEPIRDVSHYHIRLDAAHTILVRACLGVLLGLQSGIKDSLFARYAAECWTTHAQFEDVSSHIKHAIRCLFDVDKPHFGAWFSLAYKSHFDPETDFPLFDVAHFGFLDAAEHIISEHPEQIKSKNRYQRTPLHAAGHTDILSLLLKHGADTEAEAMYGSTPLHLAAEEGKLEVGRCLLDYGADVNSMSSGGHHWAPLCSAALKGHFEFCRMLIERGADVRPKMVSFVTPLTAAIDTGRIQIVRLLLEHGEDANGRDKQGLTPSQWASASGKQEILELLSEYGAESVE